MQNMYERVTAKISKKCCPFILAKLKLIHTCQMNDMMVLLRNIELCDF